MTLAIATRQCLRSMCCQVLTVLNLKLLKPKPQSPKPQHFTRGHGQISWSMSTTAIAHPQTCLHNPTLSWTRSYDMALSEGLEQFSSLVQMRMRGRPRGLSVPTLHGFTVLPACKVPRRLDDPKRQRGQTACPTPRDRMYTI